MIRLCYLLLAAGILLCPVSRAQSGLPQPSCLPVAADRIYGRDLAAAIPELALLPPDLVVGYAPTPGVQRTFLIAELKKLSLKYDLQSNIREPVCFAWPLRQLTKEVITAALMSSLAGRDAQVEIVDQCRTPVPFGDVVFPMQGLSAETPHAALWSGYVRYSGDKKFSTWIQVRVTVKEQQVIAARPIRAGALIDSGDLQTLTYSGPLRRSVVIHEDSDAKGRFARQPIAAGAVLSPALLSAPQDVELQQLVTVHIRCGGAHIQTQGIAVEAGCRGAVIRVRNPKTGRVFRAQIDDAGVVTVVPGGDVGLVVENKKS